MLIKRAMCLEVQWDQFLKNRWETQQKIKNETGISEVLHSFTIIPKDSETWLTLQAT
jgi:hypothetical protein